MQAQIVVNITIILTLAGLFYLLIPALGAFHVRRGWRRFRKLISDYSCQPLLDYRLVHQFEAEGEADFRFFGVLDAVQADSLWIRGENLSLRVQVGGGCIYLLPSRGLSAAQETEDDPDMEISDEMPRRLTWNRLFSRPAGTRVFIGGRAGLANGVPVFHDSADSRLLIITYDGSDTSVLKRSIREGRQKNEFWNRITPLSILTGAFALILSAYILFGKPANQFSALMAVCLGLMPIIPFLPPGIALLSLYRHLWNTGRALRAERDLMRLPLRFFPDMDNARKADLHTGESYAVSIHNGLEDALAELPEPALFSSAYLRDNRKEQEPYYRFTVRDTAGNACTSRDPMVESLVIPGDPVATAAACNQKAHFYERTGVALVCFGILLNLGLLFLLLTRIIQ